MIFIFFKVDVRSFTSLQSTVICKKTTLIWRRRIILVSAVNLKVKEYFFPEVHHSIDVTRMVVVEYTIGSVAELNFFLIWQKFDKALVK